MPYLRFSRDKRGYENTFVVHSSKRRGKSRSRILYWFRTPPGVRVGRAALDEAAIRSIEENNPQIQFDWTRILKGQPDTPEPQERRERWPKPRPPRPQPHPQPQAAPGAPAEAGHPEPVAAAVDALEADEARPSVAESVEILGTPEPPEAIDTTEIEGESFAPERDAPVTAAHARLGSEGLSRLRGRYAEVLATISDRVQDAVRRDELKAQAERLNPDAWVTDDEVRLGLEQYETVFESLRSVVGRRRRRRRGGSREQGRGPES